MKNLRINEAGAAWSLPWHALLRDLASGLGGGKPIRVQSVDVSAGSWLQRAHFRTTAVQARP